MQTLFKGQLQKMQFENAGSKTIVKPSYFLADEPGKVFLNNIIDSNIEITFDEKICCIACGKEIKKTYGQGYCYPCFISVPQTEECVLKPELCRAHEGIARDMEYAKKNCLVDQYVYLALSGGLKVGVTRYHQVPTRWVDQGAVKAILVAVAPNRYSAGMVEVALKKILADKTNWRKMLTQNDERVPLVGEKHKALEYLNTQDLNYKIADDTEYSIEYPVHSFPSKVNSIDLIKKPIIRGKLNGIKGQYLLFADGSVLNIRKHAGFYVTISKL